MPADQRLRHSVVADLREVKNAQGIYVPTAFTSRGRFEFSDSYSLCGAAACLDAAGWFLSDSVAALSRRWADLGQKPNPKGVAMARGILISPLPRFRTLNEVRAAAKRRGMHVVQQRRYGKRPYYHCYESYWAGENLQELACDTTPSVHWLDGLPALLAWANSQWAAVDNPPTVPASGDEVRGR